MPITGTGGPPKKPFAAVLAGRMSDLPHVLGLEVTSTGLGLTVTIGSGWYAGGAMPLTVLSPLR